MAVPRTVGYVAPGSAAYDALFYDLLEYVPALTFPLSVTTYSQMRRDPQLTAVLAAVTLPIRRAAVALDPAGCRPEVVQALADDVGVPILGEDEPGPARRRDLTWDAHIRAALLREVYGFMPFELAAEDDGTRTRLVGLYERLPQTIDDIETDPTSGALLSATQYAPAGSREKPKISGDNLLWYVREREGANWYGISLLRSAYGPWLLKHEMWRVHGISNRRNGAGTPVAEALPGTSPTPSQMREAQEMASAARVGDQSGASTPPGFVLRFKGIEGALPDTLGFIRYLDQQMSRMALAGMLDLGETPNGSRALGAEFVDLFMLALQATATEVADTFTRDVLVQVVNWNWGEDEDVPRLVISDVGSDTQITADALNLLLGSGALSADPALEEYLRKRYALPERQEPEAAPPPPVPAPTPGQEQQEGTPPAAPPGALPTAARAADPGSRLPFVVR